MGLRRKVFAVVELLDEESDEAYVEITLTAWLRDSNTKCIWPKNLIATEKVKNLVKGSFGELDIFRMRIWYVKYFQEARSSVPISVISNSLLSQQHQEAKDLETLLCHHQQQREQREPDFMDKNGC